MNTTQIIVTDHQAPAGRLAILANNVQIATVKNGNNVMNSIETALKAYNLIRTTAFFPMAGKGTALTTETITKTW
jgi:hypothetical protein